MRVGVLASGEGSNLQALLDTAHGRDGVRVVAVGSDRPGARALARAAAASVPTQVFPVAVAEPRAVHDGAMADWLDAQGVDLVVLAGYMRVLDPGFLARFPGRVINVHPSLLPAFPGLRAVEQAVAHGVTVFGVTVHVVDEGIDTGPIIAQRAVELGHGAGAADVRTALRPLEHALLPAVVRRLAREAATPEPRRATPAVR